MIYLTAFVLGISVIFSVVARCIRDTLYHSPMLHGVSLLGWLIGTFLLVKMAIETFNDPTITLAVGLFSVSMVIIETVSILLPYVRNRESAATRYNKRQAAYKVKIAGMTKKKVKMWWE